MITKEMFQGEGKEFSLMRDYTDPEQMLIKKWIGRLFEICLMNKIPEKEKYDCVKDQNDATLMARLELFADLDDHFKFNHSIAVSPGFSTADVILLCFLRRCMGFDTKNLKARLAHLTNGMISVPNLIRYFEYFCSIIGINFAAIDKKEKTLI